MEEVAERLSGHAVIDPEQQRERRLPALCEHGAINGDVHSSRSAPS